MPDKPTADATHGLSVQHADALWDAVAIPGPTEPTFPIQHERVCRAVAEILAELTPTQPAVPVSSPPPDQTALREAIDGALHRVLDSNLGKGAWTRLRAKATDAVLAVLPPADRAGVLREEAALIRAHCPDHLDNQSAEGSWINCHCDVADDMERRAAEAQEQAHPPTHAWRVETRDPGNAQWTPGSHFAHRPNAVERWETANRTAPLWNNGTPVERRIVRETTTYTVDTEHTPEPAQEA